MIVLAKKLTDAADDVPSFILLYGSVLMLFDVEEPPGISFATSGRQVFKVPDIHVPDVGKLSADRIRPSVAVLAGNSTGVVSRKEL